MSVGMFVYSIASGLGMIFLAAAIVGIAFAYLASAVTSTIINS